MLRILVAGDIRIYRDGVVAHLQQASRFTLVGTAGDADETITRAGALTPDVVVLDMAMAGSLDVARELGRAGPGLKVVALTVPDVEPAVIACAEAGVAAYVPRGGSLDDVVLAIERAARGELSVSAAAAAGLFRRVAALAAAVDAGAGAAGAALTSREHEIVSLLERGLSNKQIAAQLHIEQATVKNHVHNILEKLHVRRRREVSGRLRRPASPFTFAFDATGQLLRLDHGR